MASLSQGRFSLPDPNIAVARTTAPVDTSTASAIEAFGQLGGEAYRGHLQGKLINELQETGDIINTINAGEEAIQQASKRGEIDTASDRFKTLAAATDQGKISPQRARIEAEVILRQNIAQAPGFADQFRATAREHLGFDPSSATLNTLFNSGAVEEGPLTEEQKDMQTAQALYSGGIGTSIEENYRLIQQEKADKIRENITSRQIQNGQLNAGKVAVEGAQRAATRFNTVMAGAFGQIETQGGINDIEQFKGAVMSMADQVKSTIEQEMAASEEYAYTPEHYNQVRSRIDEQRDAYLEILDNQDLTNVLSRNRDRLADLVEIAGTSLAPDLAILRDLGEPAQQAYMDLMVLSGGDPRLMKELMAQDPRKAFVGNLILQTRDIAPSLKALADGSLGAMVDEKRLDEQTAQAVAVDQANAVVDGKPTAAGIGKIFQSLKDTKMPQTALDMVAKTSQRSYMEMTTDERTQVADSFQTVTRGQMSNIVNALTSGSVDGLRLGWNGEKFILQDSAGRGASELFFFAPRQFRSPEQEQQYLETVLPREAGVEDALNYLNETLVPIARNPNWNREMGMASGQEWVEGVLNQVNMQQMGAEVDQGGPIFESMDPAKVGEFRQAWKDGNRQKVLEILSGMPEAGINQPVSGFQSGTVQRTGAATQAQAATQQEIPPYQGNPMVPGVTRETQAVAQFEGLHDPSARTWDGKTVAYGLDLETNPRASEYLEQYGLQGASREEVAQFFFENPEISAQVLDREVQLHKQELADRWETFNTLDPARQEGLANLAYNMGADFIDGFPSMKRALEDGEHVLAARNLVFNFNESGSIESLTGYLDDVGPRRAATIYLNIAAGRWPTQEEVAEVEATLQEIIDRRDATQAGR